MNERIKELAREAVHQTLRQPSSTDDVTELFLQNYTKLVVTWCDSIVEKYSKANTENDSWVEMLDMIQTEIKDEFGLH